jgi:prophage DNA circulation protein
VFHVETSTRASGRRIVVHQYPKRNIPYAEDMGRDAVKWSFTAYLILRDKGIAGNLLTQIADLIDSLESDEAGMLIHPTLGEMLCMCDRYSYSDQRMKGGYVEFEMQFVEAGAAVMSMALTDASGMLSQSADGAEAGAVSSINSGTASLQNVPLPTPRPTAAA